MKLWYYLTGAAALIFCGTSMVFTMQLWASIPAAVGGQLVAALTAFALELCKFSFAPFGLWLVDQDRKMGYTLLVLWPFLVALSIVATVGFLATHSERQQQLSTRNSLEYQTLKQQLNSADRQIETLNSVIATDADTGYRQRAIDTTATLAKLEAHRNTLLGKLETVQAPAAGTLATFNSLASVFNTEPAQLQHAGFLALAIVTDVVGLVALLAFNSAATVPQRQPQQPQRLERPVAAPEQPAETATLTPEQEQLADRIRAGEFGERPVLRNINRTVRGGNRTVKPVFEALLQAGELKRDGQRFALVSN